MATKYSTFDEFINAHIGKAVDMDGVASAQCVDLAVAYLYELFGSGVKNWYMDAHHYWELFESKSWLKNNFTKIPNTPDFIPKKGDIMVWKPSLSAGGWGHIAICSGEGDKTYFYSYDQNWTGRHDPCTKIKHNYNHVYGVLRPKDQSKITAKPKVTYKTYYVNDKNGVNYRTSPNGTIKGTYKYATALSIVKGSETTVSGGTWVKTKENYWVFKSLLSTTKPSTSTTVTYTVGKTYTLQADMKVRTGAGANYPQKKYSQLSSDGKKNAYNQTYAVFKKGTKITALKVTKVSNTTWIQCPSGWICAKSGNTIYIK